MVQILTVIQWTERTENVLFFFFAVATANIRLSPQTDFNPYGE